MTQKSYSQVGSTQNVCPHKNLHSQVYSTYLNNAKDQKQAKYLSTSE